MKPNAIVKSHKMNSLLAGACGFCPHWELHSDRGVYVVWVGLKNNLRVWNGSNQFRNGPLKKRQNQPDLPL